MLDLIANLFGGINTLFILKILFYSSFIWVPIFVFLYAWELWVEYVRAVFFEKQTYIVLEIKLPREMFKSPQAAEFFINGLFTTLGEGNWYEKYWLGQVRSHYSLEIVSIEGGVHFFVWTKKGDKNKIEANLYSQFPGLEIYEVPDYSLPLYYDPEKTDYFVTEFDLTKPDAFPIKTYIDYGLDKDPKEEYKIDPMTPLIEALGAIGKGHVAGLQIIIRAHIKEEIDPKTGEPADLRWAKGARAEIDKILLGIKGEKDKEDKFIPGTGRQLTESERDTISALDRSVSKKGFDVGMRLLYTGPKETFDRSNIGGLVGGVMHFSSDSLNGFKPARGLPSPKLKHFLLLWKDRNMNETIQAKKFLLDAYKRRAYYYKPYKSPHFILNTEELATLFHFPGLVSSTPTFERIDSRKAEAPANLPI